MKWFSNLKMIKKLMLGIGLMATGLCFVGYMGMNSMWRINDSLERMYSLDVLGVSHLTSMGSDLHGIVRSLIFAIDASDKAEIQKYSLAVTNHDERLQKTIDQGKTTIITDAEKTRFIEIEKGYSELVNIIRQAVKMAEENNDKEATAFLDIARPLDD